MSNDYSCSWIRAIPKLATASLYKSQSTHFTNNKSAKPNDCSQTRTSIRTLRWSIRCSSSTEARLASREDASLEYLRLLSSRLIASKANSSRVSMQLHWPVTSWHRNTWIRKSGSVGSSTIVFRDSPRLSIHSNLSEQLLRVCWGSPRIVC